MESNISIYIFFYFSIITFFSKRVLPKTRSAEIASSEIVIEYVTLKERDCDRFPKKKIRRPSFLPSFLSFFQKTSLEKNLQADKHCQIKPPTFRAWRSVNNIMTDIGSCFREASVKKSKKRRMLFLNMHDPDQSFWILRTPKCDYQRGLCSSEQSINEV